MKCSPAAVMSYSANIADAASAGLRAQLPRGGGDWRYRPRRSRPNLSRAVFGPTGGLSLFADNVHYVNRKSHFATATMTLLLLSCLIEGDVAAE